MGRYLVLLALLLVGCANANCPPNVQPFGQSSGNYCGWNGDDDLYGVDLLIETSPDNNVTRDPEFRARLKRTIETAADFWGVSPWTISGWRLRLVDVPEDGVEYMDHTGWSTMTIQLHVGRRFCIETANLIHEFGHLPGIYSDGDANHSRPRWQDFDRLHRVLNDHLDYDNGPPTTILEGDLNNGSYYVCHYNGAYHGQMI